jgi:hypothetical protein
VVACGSSTAPEHSLDKELLQREQKPDVPGGLVAGAYIAVLLIGLGLYGSQGWGLARLQRRLVAALRSTPASPRSPAAPARPAEPAVP